MQVVGAAQEWSRSVVVRKGERRVWKKVCEDCVGRFLLAG